MNGIEDQARAAMLAIAATVEDAPPLRGAQAPDAPVLQPQQGRGWGTRRVRTWIGPVTAAAAVLALAISLVIIRGIPNGRVAPPAGPALVVGGVPRYYVALDQWTLNNPAPAKVVVGDTFSGPLFTLGPFPGGGAVSVTAAADDLTFVVATAAGHHQFPNVRIPPTAWYLIHITPGSRPSATVRALPIASSGAGWVTSMALSPDGNKLAMIGTQGTQGVVRIYSVGTGAVLHTWAEPLDGISPAHFVGSIWWTNDELAFTYQRGSTPYGVRLLKLSQPGHDLLADSRIAWSIQSQSIGLTSERPFNCTGFSPSALVTGNGKTVVCGASGVFRNPGKLPSGQCPAIPPWSEDG